MAKKEDKTNVMRLLEQKKVPYTPHTCPVPDLTNGVEVAKSLGQAPERAFKTLVTTGKSGEHFVFVIPVDRELDLKKAAKAAGEKSIEMLKQKDLLGLTGYIHGGCSPIGMKKFFTTFVEQSTETHETIFFSAGKVGHQVEVAPADLGKMIRFTFADLCVE